MWFINDAEEIVSSENQTNGLHPINRKRKQTTKYFLGTISRCFLGVSKVYPSIDIKDDNILSGKKDASGRFSFIFSGKDIESGEEFTSKYFANKNEIFCFYNKNLIHPEYLDGRDDYPCLIRFVSWNNNDGKEIIYPEIIYPLFITDEVANSVSYSDITEKKLIKLSSVVPHFDKKPKVGWTK